MSHTAMRCARPWWVAVPLLLLAAHMAGAQGTSGAGAGAATASNPHVSAIFNGIYANYTREDPFKVPGFALGPDTGVGNSGLQLGETEVGLYSNIDPYLFGSAVLSFAGEGGVEVEEAFLQTLALPFGFIVKAGRFHSSIGYLNVFHRHADDFVDTPLVYTAFLNGQLADDGVQLLWVAPTDVLFQVGVEVFGGGNYPAAGNLHKGTGTDTQFINLAGDVGAGGSYLLGLSHVGANSLDRQTAGPDGESAAGGLSFTGVSATNILSAVYKWSPLGNTKYTQVKLQAEAFLGYENGLYTVLDSNGDPSATTIDVKGSRRLSRSGWYGQAVLKFHERWKVGARYSAVSTQKIQDAAAVGTDLEQAGANPAIGSAMVEYWPSEFSQFRVQYSQDDTVAKQPVSRWFLQYILTMGAHAAHTY